MTSRITDKDLKTMVNRINELTGSPLEYSSIDENGKRRANIGHYCLDSAYGGVKLVQVMTNGGGIREISSHGFGTKRELYIFMRGMIEALENAE
jgi:hypothetical protein